MSGEEDRYAGPYPMRVQLEPGSEAEQLHHETYRQYCGRELEQGAIGPGVAPSPSDDLIERGGKTVAQMGSRTSISEAPRCSRPATSSRSTTGSPALCGIRA